MLNRIWITKEKSHLTWYLATYWIVLHIVILIVQNCGTTTVHTDCIRRFQQVQLKQGRDRLLFGF